MTTKRLRDLPTLERDGKNIKSFADATQEAIQTFRGTRGDPLDRALTRRDLIDGTVSSGINGGAGGGGIGGPGSGTVGGPGNAGSTRPDLTPPPTPEHLVASSGFANIFVEWDAPIYTTGHGHKQTNIYGAKFQTGGAPTFTDAVRIGEAFDARTIYAFPSDLGTNWAIWITFESKDGVESVTPAGGANGAQASVGKIGNVDLGPLIIEAGNLADGSITGTKLADEAIDRTKFANGIEPITIVSSGPLPTVLLTQTIFWTDNKLYRWNGTAYGASVAGSDIVANSITAGQIAAAAIGVRELAAGAVTAASIAITDLTNLCYNGRGASNDGWTDNIAQLGFASTWATYGVSSPSACTFLNRDTFFGPAIDVKPGEPFYASADIVATGGGGSVYGLSLGFEVRNASGVVLDYRPFAVNQNPNFGFMQGTNTMPAGSATARIWVGVNKTNGQPGGWHMTNIRVNRKNAGQLLVDGAITANLIAANAIAVGSAAIENGAIRNALIANAAIDDAKVANLSAAKLSVGDGTVGGNLKSANYISGSQGWLVQPNGFSEFSNVIVRGAVYATTGVFSGTIYAGAGAIGGILIDGGGLYNGGFLPSNAGFRLNSNGTAEFNSGTTFRGTLDVKSAASGARQEVTNAYIKQFDNNNVKRVHLGNLDL